jgi:hypothetical protein
MFWLAGELVVFVVLVALGVLVVLLVLLVFVNSSPKETICVQKKWFAHYIPKPGIDDLL